VHIACDNGNLTKYLANVGFQQNHLQRPCPYSRKLAQTKSICAMLLYQVVTSNIEHWTVPVLFLQVLEWKDTQHATFPGESFQQFSLGGIWDCWDTPRKSYQYHTNNYDTWYDE
jgi:hypothetical protein